MIVQSTGGRARDSMHPTCRVPRHSNRGAAPGSSVNASVMCVPVQGYMFNTYVPPAPADGVTDPTDHRPAA